MDTNRLRYFCVISETGSIRKASEILRLSPAALSKAIKLLETEIGFQLLVSEGRGILISDRGKLLARDAKLILNQLDLLKEKRFENSHTQPTLRLAAFEVFTTYFLGFLASRSFQNKGAPRLELRELIPGEMEQSVLSHETDLGITYLPIPVSGIEHIKVAELKMEIFGRRGQFTNVPFKDLPFAIPIQPLKGTPSKVHGLDGWPEDKINRTVRYRVMLMESALELCRQGLAVAYLPTFVVKLHNEHMKSHFQLEKLPSPKNLSQKQQPIYLIKRKSDIETQFTRTLAKAIRTACDLSIKTNNEIL